MLLFTLYIFIFHPELWSRLYIHVFWMYYKSNTINDKSNKHTPEQGELQRVQ